MRPRRIVFSDIDGTIVDQAHHARPQDAPTLRAVQAAGVPICLVSARSPEGIYPVQHDLGIAGALAAYSGAYVLGPEGEELFSQTMGLDAAVEVKAFVACELPHLCVSTFAFHTWVVDSREDPRVRQEEEGVQARAQACPNLEDAFDERGVHKLMLIGEERCVEGACSLLAARFPSLVVVRSGAQIIEVMPAGVSKARAVGVLCGHWGAEPCDAIAFGDADNDLEMLASVGTSYAMANATERARRAATHVCAYTNEEGGVARTLAELFL